jgi:MFS family permease
MSSATPSSQQSVHPLRVRDFRLLWIGESVSLLGDQFYIIALPWLVLQVTGNALALGTIMALASVPRALFMLIGGAYVDRFSPRAVMFASNLVRMVLVALFALLVLTDAIQLWMLYALALAFGVGDAFYFPAESAIVPALLEDDQLEMGNTLTQGVATLSMFVGPVLAGVVIAVLAGSDTASTPGLEGIGVAFGLDAFSFLASLVTLWMMRHQHSESAEKEPNVLASIKGGLAYVWEDDILRGLFILLVALNLFVIGPFDIGVPVLAKRNLAEGAAAFGILMSAYGGGALLGIILAGVLPRPKPEWFGSVLLGVVGLLGIGLMLLVVSTSTPVVAAISLAMGTTMGYVNVKFMTWLQSWVEDEMMGRVMSLLMFASVGVAPVSSALAGAILNVNLVWLFVGAGAALDAVVLLSVTTPTVRRMGLAAEEREKNKTIAEAVHTTTTK